MRPLLIFCAFLYQILLFGQDPIYSTSAVHHPIIASNGMVATQHSIATKVGLDILKGGGNAVDAAVAVGFALAVVLPRAGNLGGGGFMIVHLRDQNITKAINYREIAPAAATKDMFLDKDGNVDEQAFNLSALSVGVPGTVAGMIYALEKYGTMSLKDVIKPAIKLAKDGFPISYDLAIVLEKYQSRLSENEALKDIFYKGNYCYQATEILKQPDLAWSLKEICKKGKAGFYNGKIAERIVADIQAHGGILSLEDFNNYEVSESDPVYGTYKGLKIASMPPPSSGGIHVVQMLNILEELEADSLEHNSAAKIHLLTEIMRLAYADRSKYLGDPKFVDVPVEGIISKDYARELAMLIHKDKANKSIDINPGSPQDFESEETTHFSVADQYGNVVSNTYTLNFSFGAGIVAQGTGIVLNNEMADFAAKVGAADAYGLIGGEANGVAPGKRPLSSMTPTIVFKDDQPYIVTGSPGGSRIITTVLQTILNVVDHDMNIAEATHATRIHHQWFPDILYYESGLSIDTRNLLSNLGHQLKQRDAMGSTQSIMLKDGFLFGASDPRRPDATTLGF